MGLEWCDGGWKYGQLPISRVDPKVLGQPISSACSLWVRSMKFRSFQPGFMKVARIRTINWWPRISRLNDAGRLPESSAPAHSTRRGFVGPASLISLCVKGHHRHEQPEAVLTPHSSQLIFIDQQPQMAFGVQSIDRQTLKNNVVEAAKAAKVFNIRPRSRRSKATASPVTRIRSCSTCSRTRRRWNARR